MVPSVFKKKGLKNFLLNVLLVILQFKASLPVYISESQAKCDYDNTHCIRKLNASLLSKCAVPSV